MKIELKNTNYMNILILGSLLIILTSCSTFEKNMLRKRPIYETKFTNIGSSEFHQGWSDGCETGMYSGGNSFYKMFYKANQVDGYKMANSTDYSRAWNYAYWYCYRRDYVKQKSTIWGSVMMGLIK